MLNTENSIKKHANKQIISNETYNLVDVIKFICSYLVLSIHAFGNSSYSDNVILGNILFYLRNYIARIAVPFYFVAAGFFLFKKVDLDNFDFSVIKNYVFKILRLYGTWMILLFIPNCSYPLWYLGALVVAVLLLSFMLYKKVSIKNIVVLSTLLYVIGLFGDSLGKLFDYKIFNYSLGLYNSLFKNTRNGVFFGFIFVVIGMIFAKKKIFINKKLAILGLILSFVGLFFEVFITKIKDVSLDYSMRIFLLPLTFFLFYIAINIKLKPNKIYKKLRIIGMMVYYTHTLVQFLLLNEYLSIFVTKVFNVNFLGNSIVIYVLSIIITTIIAVIVERMSHKPKIGNVIKYLYS